jgi:hypothetical protein
MRVQDILTTFLKTVLQRTLVMTQLPKDFDEAIAQAKQATQAALADGLTRIQVELLFPELKVMPVAQSFVETFEAQPGVHLRVYFPDAGAAALARREWGEKPYAIRGIQDMHNEIQPEDTLILFVEPSAVEVQAVEALCTTAGDRPVVLLNPRLEDVATIGIGYAGRQLRERFLNQIDSCYYLRPIDGGAVFRCYPSPWQVLLEGEEEGAYTVIAERPTRPMGDDLTRILMQATEGDTEGNPVTASPRKPGFLSGLQSFLRALSQ